MKKPIARSMAFLLLFLAGSLSAQVYVNNYATPSDGVDDTDGIRTAIDALDKSGDTLFFGSGWYDLSGPNPNNQFDPDTNNIILEFRNCDKLVLQGDNTTLLGRQWGTVFSFFRCDELEIHDIKIDWRQGHAPHSAGIVARKGSDHVDLQIEFPTVARHNLPADRIMKSYKYAPAPSRPDYGGYFFRNENVPLTQKLGPDSLRVFIEPGRIGNITEGDRIVVTHKKHSMNVTQYFDSHGITLEGLTIHGGAGLGVIAIGCSNISLDDVIIRPDNVDGAFLSTTAASTRFISCRGTLDFDRCEFHNTGDDGTNIQTEYFEVTGINGNVLNLQMPTGGNIPFYRQPKVGDVLELGANSSTLKPKGTATIQAIDASNISNLVVTLTGPPPAGLLVGELAIDISSTPSSISINRLQCRANRGRGIILRSRDVSITNSSFGFVSGPGILLGPQIDFFHEGPSTENVTIDNCTFSRCNLGHASEQAMLSMIAHLPPGMGASPDGIVKNIAVTNCNFLGGAVQYAGRNGIELASTSEITLENNVFDADIDERITIDASSSDRKIYVNAQTFPSTTAFASHVIPGAIQAEDFDNGGEAYAYFDLTDANLGNQYRSEEEVDIYQNSLPNYDVRHIQANEWMTWTVDVTQADDFEFTFAVGRKAGRLKFRLYDESLQELALVDTTPNTTAYFSKTVPCSFLSQGTHQYRLWVDIGGFALDSISVSTCSSSKTAESPSSLTIERAPAIHIFPNPFQNTLHIQVPPEHFPELVLTDLQGKTLLRKRVQSGMLDLEFLPKGLYLVQIGDGFREKILKW